MAQSPLHESTARYISDFTIAHDYDCYFADNQLFVYDSQVLLRWFARPGKLIDLGCGTGRHLLSFARRGFDVVGIDLSEHMLAAAQRKLDQARLSVRLIRANFCNLPIHPAGTSHPLMEKSFDYALCMFSTIGLIQGKTIRLRFLQNAHGLLKTAGLLALHVHNYYHNIWSLEGWIFLISNLLRSRRNLAERGDKILNSYRGISNMYLHVFTEQEITDLLQTAGFGIIQIIPLNRSRTAPLKSLFLAQYRANGYLILARAE